jgi:Cu/Ag efflux pump CusA
VTAYAALIVAAALLPLFFMTRLAGAFFPDVAGAFMLAVLASMIVALTVIPALAALLLSRESGQSGESPFRRWLQRGYEKALARIVHRPRRVYVAAGAVLVAACAAAPFLSQSLLPTFKEEQVLIRWDAPPGTSLPEMNRITARASRELQAIPGVEDVGAHIGRAVASDLSVNANTAEFWVSIDPSADYDTTVASIGNVVHAYPGLSPSIGAFSNERAQEVLTRGPDRDVVVRVYGEDPGILQSQADRVKQAIQSVDGVADASVELPAVEPTVEVEVDLAAARAQGIKPGDVRRAATTLLGGLVVGNLFEQQKVFEVVVWGTPETRSSLTSIRGLLIDTPDGRHVHLDEVADVRIAPNPAVIQRHAVSRYLDVGASVSSRDQDAVVRDVERRLGELQFPLEYHVEVLARSGQPGSRLIGLGIAAAVAIVLLLQACFGSWGLATLSFLTFPVAVTGGVLAALAGGGALSFGSYIGLAAVLGLAARHAVLLIDRLRQLERHEGEAFGADLVLRASRERLVPIVMTASATGLALLPLVVMGPIPGYELLHPMAVVSLGGLLTSTLSSLFILPAVYLRFGSSTEPEPSAMLGAALKRRAQMWARRRAAAREIPVHSESGS